jgi:hypothetical protein
MDVALPALWGNAECIGWIVWTADALPASDKALIQSRISRGLLQLKDDKICLTEACRKELQRSNARHLIGA